MRFRRSLGMRFIILIQFLLVHFEFPMAGQYSINSYFGTS